uniref:Uncharacterized protein n=1 Tax=Leersia perrieri TaxID=77586 RepID=A0A0D9W1Z0_9ORYZ
MASSPPPPPPPVRSDVSRTLAPTAVSIKPARHHLRPATGRRPPSASEDPFSVSFATGIVSSLRRPVDPAGTSDPAAVPRAVDHTAADPGFSFNHIAKRLWRAPSSRIE